jgi:hypothetical protein
MQPAPDGEWVWYEDAEDLHRRLAAMTKAIEEIVPPRLLIRLLGRLREILQADQ